MADDQNSSSQLLTASRASQCHGISSRASQCHGICWWPIGLCFAFFVLSFSFIDTLYRYAFSYRAASLLMKKGTSGQ